MRTSQLNLNSQNASQTAPPSPPAFAILRQQNAVHTFIVCAYVCGGGSLNHCQSPHRSCFCLQLICKPQILQEHTENTKLKCRLPSASAEVRAGIPFEEPHSYLQLRTYGCCQRHGFQGKRSENRCLVFGR